MSQKIYFRSVGLIEGTYLPSSEDPNQGTLITEQGIFPAQLREDIIKFFDRDIARRKLKKRSGRPAIAKAPLYSNGEILVAKENKSSETLTNKGF